MSVEITEDLMEELVLGLKELLPDAEIHHSLNVATINLYGITRTMEVCCVLFNDMYKTNNILEYENSHVSFEDTIRIPVTECFPFK